MQSIYIFNEKIRGESIGAEGAKEIAQGLKTLINLSSLTINL